MNAAVRSKAASKHAISMLGISPPPPRRGLAPAAAPADAPSGAEAATTGSAFEPRGGDGGTAATSLRERSRERGEGAATAGSSAEEVDAMRTPSLRSIPSNEEADSWQGSLDPSSTPSRRLKVRAGLQRDADRSRSGGAREA